MTKAEMEETITDLAIITAKMKRDPVLRVWEEKLQQIIDSIEAEQKYRTSGNCKDVVGRPSQQRTS